MGSPKPIRKKYKLVFLGDQSVGKTSLITRFMYDSFDSTYQATIGIDFLSKSLSVDGCEVALQIWDTAGTERFRSLIPNYIRDLSAAVAAYDITSTLSFDNIRSWINDIRQEKDNVLIVLCGNKTDLAEKRRVSYEQGLRLAEELGTLYMETSAKSGHNVKKLFRTIAVSLHEGLPPEQSVNGDSNSKHVIVGLKEPAQATGSESSCSC